MNPASSSGREWLRAIARRAMTERGFEPDFPPDVVREANALHEPQGLPGGAVDDLRRLDWVSIDNDDSRDLDQLSVAETLDGASVRLPVAVADDSAVSATVRSTSGRGPTRLPSTRARRDLPDAAGAARPTSRRSTGEDRLAVRRNRRSGRHGGVPACAARWCATSEARLRLGWPPGFDGSEKAPEAVAASQALARSCACRTASRRR